jgi:hypothetical protein
MKICIWLSCTAVFALVATQATAETPEKEAAPAEKIRNLSPDQKFAMRISYDEKTNSELVAHENDPAGVKPLPDGVFSEAITAIALVSMPSKEKVAELLPSNDVGTQFGDITLMWSADSQWCAFSYNQHNVGYTSVFNEKDGNFVKLGDQDNLHANFKGDVRNEWVTPIKWIKPGVLVLEHTAFGLGGEKEWRFEVTVSFDAGGKVHVISQKKLKPKPM